MIGRFQRLLIRSATQSPAKQRGIDAVSQLILLAEYRRLLESGRSLSSINEAEFSAYSQAGEDGILLFLLAAVGMGGRRAVEICAADGIECNTANLVVNHGWTALMVDGDERLLAKGRAFYSANPDTKYWPPKLEQAWVTAENVNELLSRSGFTGEIDVLSLDLDGMDYWIWKAIDVASPRVVVVEYQTAWGPDVSKVVRYDPQFRVKQGPHGAIYAAGASLQALLKLGETQGYTFVGSHRLGINAFFVRNDLIGDRLRAAEPANAFLHPHAQRCVENGAAALAEYDWIDV